MVGVVRNQGGAIRWANGRAVGPCSSGHTTVRVREARSATTWHNRAYPSGSAGCAALTRGYSKVTATRSQDSVERRCCDSQLYWRHARSRGESPRNRVPMPRSGNNVNSRRWSAAQPLESKSCGPCRVAALRFARLCAIVSPLRGLCSFLLVTAGCTRGYSKVTATRSQTKWYGVVAMVARPSPQGYEQTKAKLANL